MKVSNVVIAMGVLLTGAVSNAGMSPAQVSIIVQSDSLVKAAKQRIYDLTVQDGKNKCTGLLINSVTEFNYPQAQWVEFEAYEVCVRNFEDGEEGQSYYVKGKIENHKAIIDSIDFQESN